MTLHKTAGFEIGFGDLLDLWQWSLEYKTAGFEIGFDDLRDLWQWSWGNLTTIVNLESVNT